LANRWLGIEPVNGRSLMLNTSNLSALSYENSLSQPAVLLWDDVHHMHSSNGQEQSAGRDYEALTIHK
jgi:hypothetical protein